MRSKYSLFPIENPILWDFYKKQANAFWTAEEIDLSADLADFNRKLNDGERHFVKHVLAFFNQSDGIVNENLAARFYSDVALPEARAFYAMQIAIEAVHAETYSLLLETYISNSDEKAKLFNAIETIPAIKKKADWAFRWTSSNRPFTDRLFAFAVVEGLFFSGSFCAVYWLKKRGLMPGLAKANDFISRDEGLHWTFAAALFKEMYLSLDQQVAEEIMREAVSVEKEFICESLPVDLIGMNSKLMSQYIDYTADRVMQNFGMPKLYNTDNPFDFMRLIDMQTKGNFFEVRISEYQKGADKSLDFDADF
jgi:ribonucleotide reductase beta subunit family protein with ferritin-like domain